MTPPAVMPFPQQATPQLREKLGEQEIVLAADSNPEGDTGDQRFAMINPILYTSVIPRTKVIASTTVR